MLLLISVLYRTIKICVFFSDAVEKNRKKNWFSQFNNVFSVNPSNYKNV